MAFKDYYTKKQCIGDELKKQNPSGFCLVVAVNPINNGACECTIDTAAAFVTDGTHRVATEQEAIAYRARMDATRPSGTRV